MRSHVAIRIHPIVGCRHDLTIYRKERAKGVITIAAGFDGQFKDPAQQGILIHTEEAS